MVLAPGSFRSVEHFSEPGLKAFDHRFEGQHRRDDTVPFEKSTPLRHLLRVAGELEAQSDWLLGRPRGVAALEGSPEGYV